MVEKLIEGGHDSAESLCQNVLLAEVFEELLGCYLVGEGEGRASDWQKHTWRGPRKRHAS